MPSEDIKSARPEKPSDRRGCRRPGWPASCSAYGIIGRAQSKQEVVDWTNTHAIPHGCAPPD